MAILNRVFSTDNGLYAGAKSSLKRPHVITAILLPAFILIICSLAGGIIYDVVMPESLARSSLLMAFVAQNLDYIIPFGLMICALSAWVLLREKRPLSTLGFKRGGAVAKYVIGMACGIVFYLACIAAAAITGAARLEQTLALEPFTAVLILFGFASFVVQGAAEEILYRGWQMPAIAVRYGTLAAIILSTVTFTLIHMIAEIDNPLYYLVILAFAIFLSLVAIYSESLWITCGLHATWNWMDTNLFAVPLNDAPLSTSLYGYTISGTGDLYALVNIGMSIAAIIIVLALLSIKGRKAGGRRQENIAPKGSAQ